VTLRRMPRDAWLLAALLVAAALPRLPTLAQPLLERHGFRQTWTAWTALTFHIEGIDLLHPKVPIFGPPFVLPSEFPLFQALGALLMDAGVPADPAMRTAGLLSFVAACVALWLLVRDVAGRAVAYTAVALFVTTPLALLWSRTSMIEYLSVAAGIAYCWAGLRWRDGRGARWWPVALAFGLTCALVKPPTFIAWAIPLALVRARIESPGATAWLRTRLDPRLVALGVIPIAAAFAWLAYGDSIKATSASMRFLSSTGANWNAYYYATLADRLSPLLLARVGDFLGNLTIGRFIVIFVAVGIAAMPRAPRASLWVGLALSVALTIEVFWGAYWKHDYYFVAVSAQAVALAAFGLVWLVRRARSRVGRALVVAAAVVAVAASLQYAAGYWTPMFQARVDPDGVLARARAVDAATKEGDEIVVLGAGYDPSLSYYARRSALMLTYETLDSALVGAIPAARYHTLVSFDPWGDALWVGRHWRWIGAREAPIYRLGDSAADVADASLFATDDVTAVEPAVAGGASLIRAPLTVPCDFAGIDVPVGKRGTLLRIRQGYGALARISVGYFASPVPARAVVWAPGRFTANADTVRVTCNGTPSLVIEEIVDVALDVR